MKITHTIFLCVVSLCVLIFPFESRSDETAESDTLRIGVRYPIGPLDPAVTVGVEQTLILHPVYETLVNVRYDAATGLQNFVPGLAKSWFVTDDGRTWTFHLETTHRFDDGSPVTAEAVRFSLQRALDLGRGPSSALRAFLQSIVVIDNYTLQLRLKDPSLLVLPTLADRVGYIINPSVLAHEQNGDLGSAWLAEHTAGSGPYQMVRHRPRDHHVLAANPYYHGEPGHIRRVIYKEIRDPSIRGLQLQKGKIDIALFLLVEMLPEFEGSNDFIVQSQPAPVFKNLALNTQSGLFSDLRIRRAAAHAIDYDNFVNILLSGQAKRLRGPLPPGFLGADASSYNFDFDPDKARALIAEAGESAKQPVELVYAGISAGSDTTATFLKASLEAVGLQVNLQRLSIPAMIDRVDRGSYDAVYMGWVSPHADPAGILNFWFDSSKFGASGNYARYKNVEVDQLLAESLTQLDSKRRKETISEIISRVNSELPYVYLSQDNVWTVASSRVHGYVLNPFNLGDFNLLDLTIEDRSSPTPKHSSGD